MTPGLGPRFFAEFLFRFSRGCAGRRINDGEGIAASAHKAMRRVITARVTVISRDLPGRVYAHWGGVVRARRQRSSGDRARNIKGLEGTEARAQEAVPDTARVRIKSRDHSRRVNAQRDGVEPARNIGGREGAVASTHEAGLTTRVMVISRDHSRLVNGYGIGVGQARAIQRLDGAVASAQEAVRHTARVKVGPGNHPRRVDAQRVREDRAWNIEGREGAV